LLSAKKDKTSQKLASFSTVFSIQIWCVGVRKMRRLLWHLWRVTPAFFVLQLGVSMVTAIPATAQSVPVTVDLEAGSEPATIESLSQTPSVLEQIDQYNQNTSTPDVTVPANTEGMGQVTSVSQLSDVQPTDWAFQALQNLVERYGCIAGYPDGTFRGNRALTRYEFAAGLNACLDAIAQLGIDGVPKEELEAINQLMAEFQAELATLRGRVDVLEARTAELEANQFSTTTKLTGEVMFAARDVIGDIDTGPGTVPSLAERVRLNFNTSFTGSDHLLVRLQASNASSFAGPAGTNMARLHPDRDNGNNFDIDLGWYNFPLGDNGSVLIEFAGGKLDDFAPSLNALDFGGAALGSISEFGQRNPIYRLSGPGVGGGVNYNFGRAFSASVGYLAGNYLSGGDSSPKNGFFNGTFGAIGQLTFRPSQRVAVGLTYVRSYFTGDDMENNRVSLAGGVGSGLAEQPFGDAATSADSYGVEASVGLSSRFIIGGWAGWTKASAQTSGFRNGVQVADEGDDAEIFNWAVTLAFPDLGGEGNLGGLVVGMPPKLTDSDGAEDQDTSIHLEAFYRYQITDNIGITPGLMVIFNPEHNDNNDTMFVGTVRTTFTF
jgi:hypothetical protein